MNITLQRSPYRLEEGSAVLDGERDRIYGGWMAGRRPAREWLYPQIAQLKEVDRSVALLLLDGFSCKAIAATSALQRATWA